LLVSRHRTERDDALVDISPLQLTKKRISAARPLGREVTPREIGALLAGWFSARGGLGGGKLGS
jgi:hypothetical protein